MFCPKCGTQNLVEQKYCRRCGHHLMGHRAALEGEYEDATADLKKGSTFVSIGLVVAAICKLNVLATWLAGADKLGIIINTLVALLVAVPLITIGVVRLSRARRVLSPKDQSSNESIAQSDQMADQFPTAPATDRSISLPSTPASVTEHTTLDLKAHQQTPREPSPSRKAGTVRS